MLAALLGQVTFEVIGGRYEKFISECAARGIPLHSITPSPAGLRAKVPARYYKQLRIPARSCRVRLRVLRRQGLCFAGRHWHGRWGMITGPVLFLAALLLMQKLIWSVQYVQMPKEQQMQAGIVLYQADMCPGSVVTPEKLALARQQLMQKMPQLGWLSLNFNKGRLVVESASAAPAQPVADSPETDLIAAADGTLLEVNIQQGHCGLRPGQTVAKGEVLVHSAGERRDKSMIPGSARGQVIAQVTKTYRCTQPRCYTAQMPTGRLAEQRTLCIAGHRLPLTRTGPLPEKPQITARPLEFFGLALPLTVEEALYVETAPGQQTLPRTAAEEFAAYACRQALYADFPDAEILAQSSTGSWQGQEFTLYWKVQFRADIARPSM